MNRIRTVGVVLIVAMPIIAAVFMLTGVGLGDAEQQLLPAPVDVPFRDGWPDADSPLHGPLDSPLDSPIAPRHEPDAPPHTTGVPGVDGADERERTSIDLAVYLPLAVLFAVGLAMMIRARPRATTSAAPARDRDDTDRDTDDDEPASGSPPPLPGRHPTE